MTSAMVQANGVTLAYDDRGPAEGPVILLVMGLGAQLIFWPEVMVDALVAKGFRVIRFDNRDIGLSTKFDHVRPPNPLWVMAKAALRLPTGVPYKLEDMAQDTVSFMDALSIERAHIVGASMGGMIAQLVAARYPDRVLTLTSIMSTSGARGLPQASTELRRALIRPRPKTGDEAALIDAGVAMYGLIGSPGGDPVARRELITRAYRRSYAPAGVQRQLAAIIASGSRIADLPNIKARTLVIHGSIDQLVPPEGGADTARRIPGARLEIIDNMAHDLPAHALPKVVDLIAAHAAH